MGERDDQISYLKMEQKKSWKMSWVAVKLEVLGKSVWLLSSVLLKMPANDIVLDTRCNGIRLVELLVLLDLVYQ